LVRLSKDARFKRTALKKKGAAMYYLGIDVSKASHQCVILDAQGEALGKSFTVRSSNDDFAKLVKKLSDLNIPKSDITAGLEATGNLWENIYIYLKDQGIKVTLLNPFQTDKFHQAMMKKTKTDSIDALVIASQDLKAMIDDIMANPRKYINNENENILRDGKRVWISWTNKPIIDKDRWLEEVLSIVIALVASGYLQ